MLGECQQDQVEQHQCRANQQVLNRVHPQTSQGLEQEELHKRQAEKQHRIFHRAFGQLVVIHRFNQTGAEGG